MKSGTVIRDQTHERKVTARIRIRTKPGDGSGSVPDKKKTGPEEADPGSVAIPDPVSTRHTKVTARIRIWSKHGNESGYVPDKKKQGRRKGDPGSATIPDLV